MKPKWVEKDFESTTLSFSAVAKTEHILWNPLADLPPQEAMGYHIKEWELFWPFEFRT
jgi:hypothetical protein